MLCLSTGKVTVVCLLIARHHTGTVGYKVAPKAYRIQSSQQDLATNRKFNKNQLIIFHPPKVPCFHRLPTPPRPYEYRYVNENNTTLERKKKRLASAGQIIRVTRVQYSSTSTVRARLRQTR